jgi:endonuclease I
MMISRVLCFIYLQEYVTGYTFNTFNVLKKTILYDANINNLYVGKNTVIDVDLLSMEHIFPACYLKKNHYNDLHNIGKTLKNINTNRSNYKYIDEDDEKYCRDKRNWITLEHDNKVNHKLKMFIPNKESRGSISRSILYMIYNYNYNHGKIIDKDTLIKWFYDNPPTKNERYYNDFCKKYQNNNNIFISNYNKKSLKLSNIFSKL